jgi:hypothetical protein
VAGSTAAQPAFLSKERIIAKPGFNRWLVPPAALAIHLCIGMAYGFSVFWLPLSQARGITAPAADDWKISTLGWMFTLFFVFLGSSAAVFGAWAERVGPRVTGLVAAACWSAWAYRYRVTVVFRQLHRCLRLEISWGRPRRAWASRWRVVFGQARPLLLLNSAQPSPRGALA